MTQEKLAEKADLNPKYVSEVERGNVNVSLDALVRVAKCLGVRVNELTRRI
jgi:transcriptional regulator with XRE-family HTH domain